MRTHRVRLHDSTHHVTEGKGAQSWGDPAAIHSRLLPELGGEPGLGAPRPVVLLLRYERTHALNADSAQSNPPLQEEVDSTARPFRVYLQRKTSHLKSITWL